MYDNYVKAYSLPREVRSMARPKKNGQYLNVKIDVSVYQRLEDFCENTGYSKTAVVERALTSLMNNHEAEQETLRRIADGSGKSVET